MSINPAGRRTSMGYRPGIKKAQGHVSACLVNTSVTYCNNDRIYLNKSCETGSPSSR